MIKTSLLVISREVFFYFHEQFGFACLCNRTDYCCAVGEKNIGVIMIPYNKT